MSDISGGTPIPKAVQSVSHGTDKASGIARDKQQTNTHAQEEDGRDQKKPQQQETVHSRDPAVSISASAAHLQVGEELKQKVTVVDPEGRPIIETEKATFALRPDAGLKAGDDVTLIVKDAGKQLAADLLLRNGSIIDPPIRLNLVVIAIHSIDPSTAPSRQSSQTDINAIYKPVQKFADTSVSKIADTEAETLARVLSRSSAVPAQDGSRSAQKSGDAVQNPTNLAALISAQQNQTSPASQPSQPAQTGLLNPTLLGQTATINNHLIPPSALTEVTTPQTTGINAVGLGNIITAISLAGKTVNIQLIDPSVSRVAPSEVASVISVRPFTPQDAKSLSVSVSSLGNTSVLAHVETNKGTFVINQATAANLAGEMVRISDIAQTASVPNSNLQTHSARLQSNGAPPASPARAIQVQFPENSNVSAHQQNQAEISAVHIVRAFLTPDGPRSDIRLETSVGDISLTVANNIRPVVGGAVTVLPMPSAVDIGIAQASSAAASSMTPVSVSHWPSFEQAYDILQSAAPASAEALQSLTARTAQGGTKIANSAMFLLSALGSGKTSNWLGKAAESALSQRNPQLLDLLKEDIGRLFSIASDTSGEWRALLMPFDARNQDMPMLAFLFGQGPSVDPDKHQNRQQADDEEQDETKRFVLEVQFSVLGAVQLDGSIKGSHFDLMVRSTKQFSPKLTQDTSELFSSALAAGAFTGSLGFSIEETFPVDVAAAIEKMTPEQTQFS